MQRSTQISACGAIWKMSRIFLERKSAKIPVCELTGMLKESLNQAKTNDIKTEATYQFFWWVHSWEFSFFDEILNFISPHFSFRLQFITNRRYCIPTILSLKLDCELMMRGRKMQSRSSFWWDLIWVNRRVCWWDI